MNNTEQFSSHLSRLSEVFFIEKRLPQQVFRETYGHFLFEEFDWTLSYEFSHPLRDLMTFTNETAVLVAVLDPSPEEYYLKNSHYYNWALIPFENVVESYNEIVTHPSDDSPATSIRFVSEVVVWIPLSRKWAIWGERSLESSVIGFKDPTYIPKLDSFKTWRPVETALTDFMHLCFRDKAAFVKHSEELGSNYKR